MNAKYGYQPICRHLLSIHEMILNHTTSKTTIKITRHTDYLGTGNILVLKHHSFPTTDSSRIFCLCMVDSHVVDKNLSKHYDRSFIVLY